MSPRVKRFLAVARDDLDQAMREPPGPRQYQMKALFRSRARVYVKAARIAHSMDVAARAKAGL
jgi:hypothetical protein